MAVNGPVRTKTLDLRDYLGVIRQHLWTVVVVCGTTCVLTIGITLVGIARVWQSNASLILPQPILSGVSTSTLPGQTSFSLPPAIAGLTGLAQGPSLIESYHAILRSRRVREKLIHEFDLQRRLDQPTLQDTLKALEEMTKIEVDSVAGTIDIKVQVSGTPRLSWREDQRWGENDLAARELAQGLAAGYVKNLDEFVQKSNLFQAQTYLAFTEKQSRDARRQLEQARERLRTFQETHRSVSAEDEVKALIEARSSLLEQKLVAATNVERLQKQIVAVKAKTKDQMQSLEQLPVDDSYLGQLRKQLIEQELEYALKSKELTDRAPEIIRLRLEMQNTQAKIKEEAQHTLSSTDSELTPEVVNLLVQHLAAEAQVEAMDRALAQYDAQIAQMPATLKDATSLEAEVAARQQLYTFLAQEAERAKMTVARETLGFIPLDQAQLAEKPVRPRLLLNALAGLILGGFLSGALIRHREAVRLEASPEEETEKGWA